jgi:methionyl-tRNA formyltransferase
MTYLFCGYREWSLKLFEKLSKKYKSMKLITSPKKLTYSNIKKINPKMIFFPDWSWIVPNEIINNYVCVCLHESDLPKFRGGSPLQNQIIRGITKTKTTAFIMTEKLDQGDVLLKKNLSLNGSLNEIFERMIDNDYDMITKIIQKKFKQTKQKGTPTIYKRRKPQDSELKHLNYDKKYLYNFIRMLEDPYPNAFIKIGKKRIVFKSAKLNQNNLKFTGVIS